MRGWLYYETVTTVDDQTVEGDRGILSFDGEFVSTEGVCGSDIVSLHTATAHLFEDDEWVVDTVADWIIENIGVPDSVTEGGEDTVIFYGCGASSVDDDVPTIYSVAVQGRKDLIDALLKAVETLS